MDRENSCSVNMVELPLINLASSRIACIDHLMMMMLGQQNMKDRSIHYNMYNEDASSPRKRGIITHLYDSSEFRLCLHEFSRHSPPLRSHAGEDENNGSPGGHI